MKKIKITIPPQVGEQIKYTCNRFPNLEWSGVVFYTPKNSMKKSEIFNILLVDLFPMNIGYEATTMSEFNEKIMDYQIKKGYQTLPYAIIHSHNQMSTNFSSTDRNELKENAHCHNLYVSIIVNNKGEITAKATQQLYIKPNSFYYKDELGVNIPTDATIPLINCIAEYDCEIENTLPVPAFLKDLSQLCNTLTVAEELLTRYSSKKNKKSGQQIEFPGFNPAHQKNFSDSLDPYYELQ